LWEEFLDDNRPQWFLNLPYDIQSYLVKEFGPETARPPTPPTTTGAEATPTESSWRWPSSTAEPQSSQPASSASYSTPSSASQSSAASKSASASSQPATFSTSTRSSASSSRSGSSTVSASSTGSSSSVRTSSKSTPSASSDPVAPSASNDGLTRNQKIGLGVGIPFGIFGAAALLFGCCFLLRRRRNKHVAGSVPPSSPGFIPRFAFQDKSTDHFDHRTPLNPGHNQFGRDAEAGNWEDDGYDPYENTAYDPALMAMGGAALGGASHHENTFPPTHAATNAFPPTHADTFEPIHEAPATNASPQMSMQDAQPIMAPVVFHTHSSNRARGRRTSYSSLHSVAELSEPDENMESPILGRQTTPLHRKRRPSMPMVLEMPSVPRTATIKRKPVPESPTGISPAAEAASASLLRPTIRPTDHNGSSSSGLVLSTDSNSSYGASYHTDPTSPVSPISQNAPINPFTNDYSYVEDYGPEYQTGYLDHDDGVYGGNRSLDQYPDPSETRRSSLKTEWPLRNLTGSLGRTRNKSPMWDRVYER
jgi:hypothetical protein